VTHGQGAARVESVPTRPLTTRARRYRGRLVIANAALSLELDEIGAFVFAQVDGRTSVGGIAEVVAGAYGVPASEVTADVLELVDQLLDQKLIVLRDQDRGA
jgi:hypothetical protein